MTEFRTLAALMILGTVGAVGLPAQTRGTPAAPLEDLAAMPVKEVTVFKDGHTFVVRDGKMPVNESGNVVLDDLPQPLLGTFWVSSKLGKMHLRSVTAGKRRVKVERTALRVRELIEANPGAEVFVTEKGDERYAGTLAGVPVRTSAERARTEPVSQRDLLPKKGDVVFIRTAQGLKVVPLSRIVDVTFKNAPNTSVGTEEFRNLLTLRLDWDEEPRQRAAPVTMGYVQKGLRWIPSYRVIIDGKGKARVELQATLVNELVDLENTRVNLVVGVPRFDFKDSIDPIALERTMARLGQDFRTAVPGNMFSNAIQTQVAINPTMQPVRRPSGQTDLKGTQSEDLYLFTVEGISLPKGSRMVVPVASAELEYTDLYKLEIPFGPPPEVRNHFNNSQQTQISRMLASPKAKHTIRLVNSSGHPLTTAPALILKEGRVLGQGLMTYTPSGGSKDLEITTAVDIKVKKVDREVERVPDAVRWNRNTYGRVNLTGAVELTNFSKKPVKLLVSRMVLGSVDSVSHDGTQEQINMHEDDAIGDFVSTRPRWWGWYSWPSWWYHFNSMGRVRWEVTLKPGEKTSLGYRWHYFWR